MVVKYGVTLFSSLLLVMLGSDLVTSENQETVVTLAKTLPFMMMISTSLLAPFVEEGIFRLGIKKVPTLLVPDGDDFKVYDNASEIRKYIESIH